MRSTNILVLEDGHGTFVHPCDVGTARRNSRLESERGHACVRRIVRIRSRSVERGTDLIEPSNVHSFVLMWRALLP